jgi:tRNA pseudouridine synthase 10
MKTNFEIPEDKFNTKYLIDIIKKDLKEYQFETFNLGISYPYSVTEEEKLLLKKEFQYNLVVGIEKELLKKRTEVSFGDIDIIIDFNYKQIEYKITSLYVYGIYNKYSRELPQTIDFCYKCRGKGCSFCNNTGILRNISIQEILEKYFREKYNFKELKFHGAGREDIDVLMLGNGREFIIEMTEPKERKISKEDLLEVENNINNNEKEKIKISNLKITEKEKVAEIKNEKYFKKYKVTAECETEINQEDLDKIKINQEFKIKQFTPKRVAKRRALITRERSIEILDVKKNNNTIFEIEIKAEAGLYVKEFISGEGEKTRPSISEIIGINCKCIKLDVIWIYREGLKL